MRRVAVVFLLVTAGCYGDADAFIDGLAKHSCKRLRECNQSAFDNTYHSDLGECRNKQVDALQNAWSIAQDLNCDYVPKQGRQCIAAIRRNQKDCSSDADKEITAECGSTMFGDGIDYLDCH